MQQVPQGRHRAVVQVRRPQPDAVGGGVAVALGLAVGAKVERRFLEAVERRHQAGGERVQPVGVSAQLVDVGGDLAGVAAAEVVTTGAVFLPDRFALGDFLLVQGERPGRCLVAQQPVGHPVETRRQHRFRRRAHGHGRCVVALVDLVVIAVPMQVHGLPGFLVPDLWQIHGADGGVIREAEHHHFGRVEGVGPPRSLGRTQLLPGIGLLLLEQRTLGHRDDQVTVVQFFEKTQLELAIDRRHHRLGGEFRVAGAIVGEPLEGLQLQGIGRRGGDRHCHVSGIGPVGTGVAQGAIGLDRGVTELPLGHADGQVFAVFIEKTEHFVAAGLGQFFRAHLR
ncbi:hypothetical protein [Pseudomonas sp. NFACC14]|uniref:hypothetical protein n=1 Tax=unclassified Pseudomonas TaxID=196821 RepID=UPI0035319065